MDKYVLDKSKLDELLKALAKDRDIWVPVETSRGTIEFEKGNSADPKKHLSLTRLPDEPPKKILFPQSEELLRFKRKGKAIEITQPVLNTREQIIFGLKPCDCAGIHILDGVFLEKPFCDPYYSTRRKTMTIFSIACNNIQPTCFCLSVDGSPISTRGSDVAFYDIGDRYYVETLTERGKVILNSVKFLLDIPIIADEEKRRLLEVSIKTNSEMKGKTINRATLDKMETLFESEYWHESARDCIGCGICTYCCPTCSCFDINDERGGLRVRTWDSCQFPDFTMHTSGYNPRPDSTKRLRNRFYHKFIFTKMKGARPNCVGCGRCIALCPAGVDITAVINGVR